MSSALTKSAWALFVGILALAPPASEAVARTTRPIPAISRALIISVDGLRSDALLRANAPAMRALMNRGAFTMWAQTTAVGVTLPSHVSMLTGVPPGKHGIDWNTDLPLSKRVYPKWPTLFELAHRAGYSTAMAAGKSKFSALMKPGTLDWSYVPTKSVITDAEVTAATLGWIEKHSPRVLFVHLPGVDSAGHDRGWGSPTQLAAIATADSCIGLMVAALERKGLLDSTVVIVSSDHGGAGTSHGADDVRSRIIPWIAAGPGICPDLDLTTHAEVQVRTEDTFATVCWLLGIPIEKTVDGHPVTAIHCRALTR